MAMVVIDGELRKRKAKAKMILQVHDELIFDLPAEEVEELTPVIVEVMETALLLSVPVKVDVKVGKNWGEC